MPMYSSITGPSYSACASTSPPVVHDDVDGQDDRCPDRKVAQRADGGHTECDEQCWAREVQVHATTHAERERDAPPDVAVHLTRLPRHNDRTCRHTRPRAPCSAPPC